MGVGYLLKSEVEKYWVTSRENNIYFSYSGKEERESRGRGGQYPDILE